MKKNHLPTYRGMRNVFIFSLILVVIYSILGALYVWYIGQYESDDIIQEEITNVIDNSGRQSLPDITPVEQDENALVGVSVQVPPSSVSPGDEAYLSIRTNSNAECQIELSYGNKTVSEADGLIAKTADVYGSVSWHWIIDSYAPSGEWPVVVTCFKNDNSGVVAPKITIL